MFICVRSWLISLPPKPFGPASVRLLPSNGVWVTCGRSNGSSPPDAVILGAAVVFALAGVITPEDVFSGFVNPGVLTVAALFVVAAAVRFTRRTCGSYHLSQLGEKEQRCLRQGRPSGDLFRRR